MMYTGNSAHIGRLKNNMTVKDYVYDRPKTLYGRPIRILNSNHKYLGQWWMFSDSEIKEIKITTKYIFIFIH